MQGQLRASGAPLRIPLRRWGCRLEVILLLGCCLFLLSPKPFSFADASSGPCHEGLKASAVAVQPEMLLDNFVCAPVSAGETEVDGGSISAADDEEPQFRLEWQAQVPCVQSRSVNVFAQHRVEPGNVLLMADIDDTLIASGGWTWLGKSLGGTDNRYARGSDYPGFAGLLYLLGLGPHRRDVTTNNLKVFKSPLQIAVVSGRPNLSFFRPDYLLPHLDAILTRGVRQVTNDTEMQWRVGAENNMLSPKMLKGLEGRAELKVSFCLDTIRRKEPLDGSRINANTRFMFIGDTGERDPEVSLALAAAEPGPLLAIFMNVVRRTGDPHWRQTLRSESGDEGDFQAAEAAVFRSLPGTQSLSGIGKKVASAVRGAASKAGAGLRRSPHPASKHSAEDDSVEMDVIRGPSVEEDATMMKTPVVDDDNASLPEKPHSQVETADSGEQHESEDEEARMKAYIRDLAALLVKAGEDNFKKTNDDSHQEGDPSWEPGQQRISREAPEDVVAEAEEAVEQAAKVVAEAAEAAKSAPPPPRPVQRTVHGTRLRSSHRRPPPPRVSISEALADTKRFAIRVGDSLVDALQLVFDVHIATDDLDGPQKCSALSARQALAVAMKVGQKLRNIWDAYDHRWKHTPDGFNVAAPGIAGLSASRERMRRPLPLVFVQCNRVQPHITNPPDAFRWRRFWSYFMESSERIDVKFIVKNDSVEHARGYSTSSLNEDQVDTIFDIPENSAKPSVGTPVAPHTTTLSAAAHAYVLGLIDVVDLSIIVRKTHEALRSQGPLSRSARLPVLLDHLYDLEGLKGLLFSRGAPESGPVRDLSDLIDSLLISQYAFAKRAAYVRAFPNRQQECIHDLQRSLLEVGQVTSTRDRGWQCSQGRLVAFGTPFAAFVCEHDLELASLQFAGASEIAGLAVTLTKVVREALVAVERANCNEAVSKPIVRRPPPMGPFSRADNDDRVYDEVDGLPGRFNQQCTLPPEKVKKFEEYYALMCEAFAPIACQLLKTRLGTPVLEDLFLLAESRAANRSGPVDLPHFGLRIFHDEDVQDYFENLHQRPATQLLGFLGSPVDYALQPADEGAGVFEKWPAVDSVTRWKSIAETIGHLLNCKLIS